MKLKKLNNVLIFLITLISLCYAVRDFNYGAYDRLLSSLSIVLVLFIPRILTKILKSKIPSTLEFIYIIFIFLAQFLGSVVNLYSKIWWYDLFMHFLSGIFTAVIALFVLKWFGLYKEKNKSFNIVFIISFSLMVASLWEFGEFFAYNLFGMDVQHHLTTGVFDTMQDMLVAFLGSIIISCYYSAPRNILKKIVNDL